MTTKKTDKGKPSGPNYELGQHYNFCEFRIDALGHRVRGLLIGGTDWQGKEEWEFMVLLDDVVQTQSTFATLKEARQAAWRFQYGHLHNLIDYWTEEARNH